MVELTYQFAIVNQILGFPGMQTDHRYIDLSCSENEGSVEASDPFHWVVREGA